MANTRNQSGAVHRAALLFSTAAIWALWFAPSYAQLRVERLWLVPQGAAEIPLDVEIAEDAKAKQLGLMFRTELADDRGMLFPYGEPREIGMWMRNTYIPLDMLFIRPDGVIHRIEERTEPLSERLISSQGDVSAVLEIPGGAAARLGIKAGDRVRHRSFGN